MVTRRPTADDVRAAAERVLNGPDTSEELRRTAERIIYRRARIERRRRRFRMTAYLLALVSAMTGLVRFRGRSRVTIAQSTIRDPAEHTTVDDSGAVRSTQAADLSMPDAELDKIWSPLHLERLARTYWRYLTRITLGLIQIKYSASERAIVLVTRPFVLLRFHPPEYWMDPHRGIVRWRIRDGVLVSPPGRDADGYLQIDMERCPDDDPTDGRSMLHVEVEVANFYPAIAWRLGLWLYKQTQSKIHVIVTHGFLRSLARLDLAESRVGRFVTTSGGLTVDDVPDPPIGQDGRRLPRPSDA